MKWDRSKSQMSDEKRELWRKHTITGDLKEVPGLGAAAEKVFKNEKNKIVNTYQLLGDMLKHLERPLEGKAAINEFGDILYDRLKSFGVSGGHIHTIVHALIEKVENGIQIQKIGIPESQMKDEQWTATRKMKSNTGKYVLSGNFEADFHYIGPDTVRKLGEHEENPLTSSWQLLGVFLEHYDPKNPDKSLENFNTALQSYGNLKYKAIAAQCAEILIEGCLIVNRK